MDRRRLLIPLVIVVALIAAVVIGGPLVYAAVGPKAEDPFSVTAATGSAASTTPRPASAENGTWSVASGSQAGYTVNEVLNGKALAVVGRTDKVTGSASVAGGKLTAGAVTVDAGSIATDNTGRDNYFRFTVISAGKYPQATFTLGAPVALPDLGGRPVEVTVPGTLSLAGETRSVSADVKVVRDGDRIAAAGSIPIVVRDFGIDPPNLGFVKVEDHARVEFRVNLAQAG